MGHLYFWNLVKSCSFLDPTLYHCTDESEFAYRSEIWHGGLTLHAKFLPYLCSMAPLWVEKPHNCFHSLTNCSTSACADRMLPAILFQADKFFKKISDVYGHEHVVCKTRYNCFLATPSNIGLLRKPSEGQSLLSFLSSQDFHTCTDLDRVYFKCTFILFDSLYVGICMLCILCMLPSHSHHVIMF